MQTSHDQSDNVMETSNTLPETHPVFAAAFPTDDVALLSKDDVLFPISSTTLSRTSPWFRAMFILPQDTRQTSRAEPIAVSEGSQVLGHLLSMISGISLPPLNNVDDFEPLLYAAEKYEMAMPIAILRLALRPLIPSSPIRVYGIACPMSWEDETKSAASRMLEMDLVSEKNATELGRLEATHLTKLLLLHERKRKMVIAALADPKEFNVGNAMGRRCRALRAGAMSWRTTVPGGPSSSPGLRSHGGSIVSHKKMSAAYLSHWNWKHACTTSARSAGEAFTVGIVRSRRSYRQLLKVFLGQLR